jgi:hypothetical protein
VLHIRIARTRTHNIDCHIRLHVMRRRLVHCAVTGVIAGNLDSNFMRPQAPPTPQLAAILRSEPGAARNGRLRDFRERRGNFRATAPGQSTEVGLGRDENDTSGHL